MAFSVPADEKNALGNLWITAGDENTCVHLNACICRHKISVGDENQRREKNAGLTLTVEILMYLFSILFSLTYILTLH